MTKHSSVHPHTVLPRVDGDTQFDLKLLFFSLQPFFQAPADLAKEIL